MGVARGVTKEEKFVDLGKYGTFSEATLRKNRRIGFFSKSIKMPYFLAEKFSEREIHLKKIIKAQEMKRVGLCCRIIDVMEVIESIKMWREELKQINEYRNKVWEIIKRR